MPYRQLNRGRTSDHAATQSKDREGGEKEEGERSGELASRRYSMVLGDSEREILVTSAGPQCM